ncbi:NAD(P)-dependent oxidoreductase [Croceicoccus estronivorus]|uniref:NAD(P)-dependent oxidoreductase n=1 Tax=Croceicoccus estronivorus TaxID=1172626 RepID=UPI0012E7AFDF|nr:NAD(P)-binding domain-containing protein [Croceicoccus estronivorus]
MRFGKIMRMGFIGLGNIGLPIAQRIVSMGDQPPMLFDVAASAYDPLSGKFDKAQNAAALAQNCELIGICVRNGEDCENVVSGPGGLLEGLSQRKRPDAPFIAIHSTVPFSLIDRLSHSLASQGATLIDAAVTGGPWNAEEGQLVVMVGGEAAAVDSLRPMLDCYCNKIIHAGPLGAGMKLKAANNLVTYAELLAAVEAVRLLMTGGVAPEKLIDVMETNGNLTPSMRAYLVSREGATTSEQREKLLAVQSALASLAEKDLSVALEFAEMQEIPAAFTESVKALFRPAVERID